jgi:hypothetical protein
MHLLVFHSQVLTINNTKGLVVSKENGPEVNSDKSNYMGMSRDQNVGRSYFTMIDNSSFENVEEFRYVGTN